jgi:hypothetical protein
MDGKGAWHERPDHRSSEQPAPRRAKRYDQPVLSQERCESYNLVAPMMSLLDADQYAVFPMIAIAGEKAA